MLRVLVISKRNLARKVADSLEGSGMDIAFTSGISDAIFKLKAEKFDLALLDAYMDDLESACYRINWQCRTPVALIIKGSHQDWNLLRSLDVEGFIPEEAETTELYAHFSAIARKGNPGLNKARVLVIEDDEQTREALRLSFQIYWPEAELSFAKFGAEGVSLARRGSPDAILLDLKLPDVSGFEVLDQIRSFTKTPVIIVTASKNREDCVRTIQSGANDYVLKPFKQLELMSRIRQQIDFGVAVLNYNCN